MSIGYEADKVTRLIGWFPIISAFLLLVFWFSFAAFLPMHEEYINWVLDEDWTWVNIIGFSGSLLGIFGILTVFQFKHIKSMRDYTACFLSIIGIVFLTSILFFEAFILKGIAVISPDLINPNSSFYQGSVFKSANLLGGLFFSMGIVSLSIFMIKEKTFRKWKLICLIIGAPLFGIMLMPGNLRILGVILYTIAFIGIGFEILNRKSEVNN